MELLQKYWYIVLAGIVLLFLLSRKQGGGTTVQQIGGADANTLALAQLSSAERDADQNRKYGLISSLLSYNLSNKSLDQQIDLAKISATAQTQALANQYSLAQLAAQLQQSQTSQQAALQQSALQQAAALQTRHDWLSAISTGIQTVVPALFGNQTQNNGGLFGGGFGGIFH